MTPELSARGQGLLDRAPMPDYLHAHFDRLDDHYDADTNPDGYIGVCVAENKLVWDLLRPKLTAARPSLPHKAICYDEMIGSRYFREQLSAFMSRTFLKREFDPAHIAVMAGTGSVLEIVFHNLADSGDAVLVPTPSYAGFWADLETRDELNIVPVHTRSADGFTLTEALLDAAFESSERPVKALLFTNPSNPLGTIASVEELEMVMRWTEQRGIHLVLDEVYALSIHGDAEFVSGAAVRPILGDHIHILWAFSKDFGSSGLRCGVLITENEELMRSVDALAYWSVVSGDTQHILGEMISDTEWVDDYLVRMRQGLSDSYAAVTAALDEEGIGYVPAEGAYFLLCDLRGYLDAETFEAEDALWRRILDEANVNVTPGSACRNGEPGFMRLCFATEPKETVVTAVRRLGKLLG
jgi:aspartate/methionine/tyrosine aminotransferase